MRRKKKKPSVTILNYTVEKERREKKTGRREIIDLAAKANGSGSPRECLFGAAHQ